VLAAATDANPARQLEQACEANFFVGHWALRQGDKREAVRLFRIAATACPRRLVEGNGARAELRALGEKP
jgi:lipoprotein NlpI